MTQKALRIRGRTDEELQKTLEERCRRQKQMQVELNAQQVLTMTKAVDFADDSATTELSRLRMEGTQCTCFTTTKVQILTQDHNPIAHAC